MIQDVRLQHELVRAMRRSEAEQAQAVDTVSPHEREVTRLTQWYFEQTRAEFWGREQHWESEWAGYTQSQQDVVSVEIAEARASANALAREHLFQAAEQAATLEAEMQAQQTLSRAEALQMANQTAAAIGHVQHQSQAVISTVHSEATSKIQ